MEKQKEMVRAFIQTVAIPEISAKDREKLVKTFVKAIGLKWEEVSEGANFELPKVQSRAINKYWCAMFPWSC